MADEQRALDNVRAIQRAARTQRHAEVLELSEIRPQMVHVPPIQDEIVPEVQRPNAVLNIDFGVPNVERPHQLEEIGNVPVSEPKAHRNAPQTYEIQSEIEEMQTEKP